jgi:gp16 family phage-associated protein
MEKEAVVSQLKSAISRAGMTPAAWARENNISASYVHDVLTNRRDPGESILVPLGLERVVSYRQVRK